MKTVSSAVLLRSGRVGGHVANENAEVTGRAAAHHLPATSTVHFFFFFLALVILMIQGSHKQLQHK